MATSVPLSTWAKDLVAKGSVDIHLDLVTSRPDRSKHCPDAAYAHKRARFPGLVIEASHSQKSKDLPRIADNYILGSNGNIKMVVGLDLAYGKRSKLAKASIWRSKLTNVNDMAVLPMSFRRSWCMNMLVAVLYPPRIVLC